MNFCINCANFVLHDNLPNRKDLGMCSRYDNNRDPVTGEWDSGNKWQFAKVVRSSLANDYCGQEGKYYVAKEDGNV